MQKLRKQRHLLRRQCRTHGSDAHDVAVFDLALQHPVYVRQHRRGEILRRRKLFAPAQSLIEKQQPDKPLLGGRRAEVFVAKLLLPRLRHFFGAALLTVALLSCRRKRPLSAALDLGDDKLLCHARHRSDAHCVDLTLHRAGKLRHHVRRRLDEGDLFLVHREVKLVRDALQTVVDVVLALFKEIAECVRTLGLYILVGVLCARKTQHTDL